MSATKRIFVRDCVFNAFRRTPPRIPGHIYVSIAEIWNIQSNPIKRKYSERDFLSVISDLVAIGKVQRFAGDLALATDAPEIVSPDYHAFCKAIFGLSGTGDGRYAVVSFDYLTDVTNRLAYSGDVRLALFPNTQAAADHAQRLSDGDETRVPEYHGCLDLLRPELGPGCDLDGLFWEVWSLGTTVETHTKTSLEQVSSVGGAR